MSADRGIYLDSSALVKLVLDEPESPTLRRALQRRRWWLSSALARAELGRALRSEGGRAVLRGEEVLEHVDLLRVNDRVLGLAAEIGPPELRTLEAIHLATAELMRESIVRFVTYDVRLGSAARDHGFAVVAPA